MDLFFTFILLGFVFYELFAGVPVESVSDHPSVRIQSDHNPTL
jgi:hypothetical protein